MEYPKRFTNCPVCGSSNRIIESEVKIEIEAGHLLPNAKIPVLVTQSQIVDLQDRRILLTRRQFPLMIGLYDICADCGILYCIEMLKHAGILEAHVKSNPPGIGPGAGPGIGN